MNKTAPCIRPISFSAPSFFCPVSFCSLFTTTVTPNALHIYGLSLNAYKWLALVDQDVKKHMNVTSLRHSFRSWQRLSLSDPLELGVVLNPVFL